jgi:hypothetical protein
VSCIALTSGCATVAPVGAQVRLDAARGQPLDDATCSILSVGNQYYVKEDYAAAIEAYRIVETIDRHGTTGCTASVYASIATCYSILAARKLASSPKEAVDSYRTASWYNRAFAYAVDCQLRDCGNSIDYWKQN